MKAHSASISSLRVFAPLRETHFFLTQRRKGAKETMKDHSASISSLCAFA